MLAVVVGSLLSQLPSPSCMLNNESCPIPRGWEADWSVLNSTAMMAAAESDGGFRPVHKWGYVTLDWQVGMLNWLQRPPGSTAPTDPAKTTCEATSAANCAALKVQHFAATRFLARVSPL